MLGNCDDYFKCSDSDGGREDEKATKTTISKLTVLKVAVLIVAIATVLSAASAAATFPVGCYCCSSVLETTLNSEA